MSDKAKIKSKEKNQLKSFNLFITVRLNKYVYL